MAYTHIIGGGTFSHVRNHLALAAPAFGGTARALCEMLQGSEMEPVLHLTKMADPSSRIVTNDDVDALLDTLLADPDTKVVILNAALCDFDADVVDFVGVNALMSEGIESGPHATRLKTRDTRTLHHPMGGAPLVIPRNPLLRLTPARKLVRNIRNGPRGRKDVFLVAFKTTTGATEQEQYLAALTLLKEASCNLVLANDPVTRRNMIVVPEEARYHVTTDREEALRGLVEMVRARSGLHFTRSTVVGSEADLVPWTDERVPANLREVVDYCVKAGAYKPFRGSTAGHFAVKLPDGSFLTSRRKTNFNEDLRLVRVEADGDDRVVAYGARPSVGGQSQRIVFREHPETDCIVHAHVPLREGAGQGTDGYRRLSVVPQWPRECGSHECGAATSGGLTEVAPGIKAVMLENHGPNIVFDRSVPPERVIRYIEDTFDLSSKTGGPVT